MVVKDLFQEIMTLSTDQLASVYSFVYLLKHPDFLHTSMEEKTSIEPFSNEREALDFTNYYAERVLNEAR